MSTTKVVQGSREELQRWLHHAVRRGEVVQPPSHVTPLAGGRWRITVRLQPPIIRQPPPTPVRGVAGQRLAGSTLRRFDRRLAAAFGVPAALALLAFLAGLTGVGVGVLKTVGVLALLVAVVAVVVVVFVGEIRSGGRR